MKEKNDDGTVGIVLLMLAVGGVTVGLLAILACAARALVE